MKKQLLLISAALFSIVSASAQNTGSKPQPSTHIFNMAERIAQKFAIEPSQSSAAKASPAPANNISNPVSEPEQLSASQPPSSISWKLIAGSSNCYGQLVSNTRPLQYNPDIG